MIESSLSSWQRDAQIRFVSPDDYHSCNQHVHVVVKERARKAMINSVNRQMFEAFFVRHNIPMSGELILTTETEHALLTDARDSSYFLWLFVKNALLDPNKGSVSTNFNDSTEAYDMYSNFTTGVIHSYKCGVSKLSA
jgi:hypothetical protein